ARDEKPRWRLGLIAPLAIFLALASIFLFQLLSDKDPSAIPSALLDKPVPDFSLPPLDGLTHDGAPVPGLASAAFHDRLTVVNVFASWCGPCRQEHPLLMRLAENEAIQVVGINYKDLPENARRFLGELGNPYAAVGIDARGRAAIDWGVYGVPETFLVGPDGIIRNKIVGPLNEQALTEVLLPAIEKLSAGEG